MGKLGIPDAILHKPGPLNDEERAIMRTHPEIGEHVVAAMPQLAHLAAAIRAEHEHWDGTGYPDGLRGAAIPLESCIVLVCDAFHAMTSDRPYRTAMSPRAALEELTREAGRQFCPHDRRRRLGSLTLAPSAAPTPSKLFSTCSRPWTIAEQEQRKRSVPGALIWSGEQRGGVAAGVGVEQVDEVGVQ
jgi:HD-GYP domain-containing protein (c-di-GMP phosphodiesterase class II)